jgi:hypothetical protein
MGFSFISYSTARALWAYTHGLGGDWHLGAVAVQAGDDGRRKGAEISPAAPVSMPAAPLLHQSGQ